MYLSSPTPKQHIFTVELSVSVMSLKVMIATTSCAAAHPVCSCQHLSHKPSRPSLDFHAFKLQRNIAPRKLIFWGELFCFPESTDLLLVYCKRFMCAICVDPTYVSTLTLSAIIRCSYIQLLHWQFSFGFQHDGMPRTFSSTYSCYSVSMLPGQEREDVEKGGKSKLCVL